MTPPTAGREPGTGPEPEPGTGPGSKVRVLVADDQRVVRDGLVLLVGMLDGIEVVGAAGNGTDAVELAERLRPDVVLMDLDMPVLGGVAATELLRERQPDTAVLVLTTYADDDSVFPALRAGARGYLTKDADDDQVEAAIHNVHRGRTWLDPVVQARLVAAIQPGAPAPANSPVRHGSSQGTAAQLPDGLTPREAEVLTLIADGLSNVQICARLVISQATVKTHINRIFTKIGVTDRAQAVRYAYRNDLTTERST